MAAIKTKGKRESILDSAITLWQKAHNVNKVSIADIAEKTGVSPTTIYNLFGTREGLVEAVIKHLTEDILAKQKAALGGDMPFPAKIQRMLSAKLTTLEGMQSDLLDKICTDPAARRYVNEITETETKPLMRAIFAEGKRQGYIKASIPLEAVMLYFDILAAGFTACSDEMKSMVADKKMMQAVADLIYFGLFQKRFELNFDATGKKEKS